MIIIYLNTPTHIFIVKTMTESQCVAELFKLYQELIGTKIV